jgi:hypothetical protein
VTERSITKLLFAGGLDRPRAGNRDNVEERSALVRVAVLCRLLREALYEIEMEMPTAQLTQELIAIQERAEAELSR